MRIFQINPWRSEVSDSIKDYFGAQDALERMIEASTQRAIEESKRTGEKPIEVFNRWLEEAKWCAF